MLRSVFYLQEEPVGENRRPGGAKGPVRAEAAEQPEPAGASTAGWARECGPGALWVRFRISFSPV